MECRFFGSRGSIGPAFQNSTAHFHRWAVFFSALAGCTKKVVQACDYDLPTYAIISGTESQDGSVTRTMYSNNIPTICATVNPDGTAVWKGLTCPLIER